MGRDRVRIVQIGMGGFGRAWVDVVRRSGQATLAAVVDTSPQARATAQAQAGDVPAFSTIYDARAAVAADAALIVVPPVMHEPVALAALEAGWHVLIEKPLAHDLAAACRLVAAAERTGLTVMVSQDYRWSAPVATLRHHLQAGLAGAIGSIRYTFNKAWDFGGWRATLPDVLLEDMTIHHADLLRYLTGCECEEVYAHSYRPSWSWFAGNAAASILMRFGGGVHVSYHGSWVGAGPQTTWTGTIEIEGADGLLALVDDAVIFYPRGAPNSAETPAPMRLPPVSLLRERQDEALARFITAVQEGTRPETAVHDNIQSFAIVCAAVASARANQPVRPVEVLAAACPVPGGNR